MQLQHMYLTESGCEEQDWVTKKRRQKAHEDKRQAYDEYIRENGYPENFSHMQQVS